MKILKKTRETSLLFGTVIILTIAMAGCNKGEIEKQNFINPPFKDLNPEFLEFTIDNQRPDTLRLKSGTRIIIPDNAFTDSSGQAVIGKVTVKYREFHDAIDILKAGIPMLFNTRGENKYLQTAGMFEIDATKNGKPLQIGESKSIKIQMGSRTAGIEYNFFGFNENTGMWEFMGYPHSQDNPEYTGTKKRIEQLEATQKIPLAPHHFIFDYYGALDVYKYELNKDIHDEELKNKIKEYGLELLNVYNNQIINYRGNDYAASFMVWKNLNGKPFPKWLTEKSYFNTNIEHLYGSIYQLHISHNDGHHFSCKVKCIMPLRSLLAFSPAYWKNNYKEAMKQMKEEEERLKTQAKVLRAFEINELGLYNFDCIYEQENPIKTEAEFTLSESYNNGIYELKEIFILPGNNKSLIKLNKKNWKEIWLDAQDTNFRIITVLPGNKLGLYPLENYRSLNFDSLRKMEHPRITFTLNPVKKEISTGEDLEQLLGL